MSAPAGTPGSLGDASRWPMRLTRAAVFAAAGTGLAASAHVLAGGPRPSAAVLATALGALLALGLAVSGRERSGTAVAALVLTTQAGLHAAFALLPMNMGRPAATDNRNWAELLFCQHGSHPITPAQLAAAKAGLQLDTGAAMHSTGLHAAVTPWALFMLGAHLVAAGVLAWWLRRGERSAWQALRRIVARLTAAVDVVLPAYSVLLAAIAAWTPSVRLWGAATAGRAPPLVPRLHFVTG